MLYDLEQGPIAEDLIAIAEKFGQPIPDETRNRPELLSGLRLYYRCFVDLHTCRNTGFGASPIPFTSIMGWMNEMEVSGDQRRRGFYLIDRMDRAYLDFCEKERKKQELLNKRKN